MNVNLDKLQAIILQKGNKNNITNNILNIENIKISKTLGITIDEKLNFGEHISVLCKKKHLLRLNAISRLQKYIGKKKKRQ